MVVNCLVIMCIVWFGGRGGGLYWNSCCFLFKLLILIIKSIYVYLDFVIISCVEYI